MPGANVLFNFTDDQWVRFVKDEIGRFPGLRLLDVKVDPTSWISDTITDYTDV